VNTLERRVRAATRATAEDIAPGSIPPLSLPRRGPHRAPDLARTAQARPGWARALVPLAAAAAVLAVIAGVVAVSGGPHGRTAGTSVRGSMSPASSPGFRVTGTGPQTYHIECATGSVCYATVDGGLYSGTVKRTADGGATWRPVAALPDHLSFEIDGGFPSCQTTEVCAGWAGPGPLQLAVTANGGASWQIEPLPVPPGYAHAAIDEVSCATADQCVVHLSLDHSGTFLSTVNGGATWAAARAVPSGAPNSLWVLRCDPDGRCIGLEPTGTNQNGELVAMRSADNGRTWAVSSPVRTPSADLMSMSCGDALHCLVAGDGGAMMTTSDGGVTWRENAAPRAWPDTATAVSCATSLDCYIALADADATPAGYHHPVVEATHDGGRTWTALSLPAAGGSPLAVVYPLSCPSAAGCIGVGATAQQLAGSGIGHRTYISSFPAPQHAGA